MFINWDSAMHRRPLAAAASLIVMLGSVAATTVASAHHAFSAEFDINKPLELTGVLTKVQWVNPHSWVYVDVKNPDGSITNWAVELVAVSTLRRRGVQRSDFPLGTEVIVKAYQAKSGRAVANAASIKLPDGQALYDGEAIGP